MTQFTQEQYRAAYECFDTVIASFTDEYGSYFNEVGCLYPAAIYAIKHSLKAMADPMWQPIETAPSGCVTEDAGCRGSSERFLGVHKSGEVMIIRRLPTMHSYDFADDCENYWTANNFIRQMPLPAYAAPKEGG